MRRIVWLVALVLVSAVPVVAQSGETIPYAWAQGDLALVYPIGWDEPLATQQDGAQILQLAQRFVSEPVSERPPDIPIITLAIYPGDREDEFGLMANALRAVDIVPSGPVASTLAGIEAQLVVGTSADGQFYGMGQVVRLPDQRILVMVGRGLAAQRDTFEHTFEIIASSLALGVQALPQAPQYGVLWYTQRSPADAPSAFLNLTGLAYANGVIYTLDADSVQGVIRLDAATGAVLDSIPFDGTYTPSDISVDENGTIYVSDLGCACIHVADSFGNWGELAGGFAGGAPASVAVSGTTVYATDVADLAVVVRAFDSTGDHALTFDVPPLSQPHLVVDRDGRLLAVGNDASVWRLDGSHFTMLYSGAVTGVSVTAVAVNSGNNLVLATQNQGIIVVDGSGSEIERIGRVVPAFPRPGELVSPHGVAVGADDTIYWADSDGSFGAVAAMSTQVASGRVGAAQLVADVPVQGVLDDFTPQQTWTYDGLAGQVITLTAVDINATGQIDLALRLLGPDGVEIAHNDNHQGSDPLMSVFDAQIEDFTLPADGTYFVIVELVNGSGTYALGLTRTRTFDFDNGAITVSGALSDIFPVQRWQFQGHAGEVVTVTMSASSGTLDPILRLFAPDGSLVDENDDTGDPALGKDSQIAQVRLPADGIYTLDATRYEGEGRYQLIAVLLSQ